MEDKKQNNQYKVSLPTNHIDISNKNCSVNIKDIVNEDCQLILFELPKNFDKNKFKNMTINKFRKHGNIINLSKNYNGICFDQSDSITSQNIALFNNTKKNSVILKPINRYVKVYEIFDLIEPNENNIIKRELQIKDNDNIKSNKNSIKKIKNKNNK